MATQDWIKKTTVLLVIASQLAIGSMHVAQATTQETPEADFIVGVEALKGQGLSPAEKEKELTDLASTYSKNSATAGDDGRVERFSQALVDLGVASSQQALEIATKAKNDPRSLSDISLDGAQFSGCVIGLAVGGSIFGVTSWYAATVYNADNAMDGFVALMMALPIGALIIGGTCGNN